MEKPENWAIDLRRKTAIHQIGFIAYLTNESGHWMVRRSNAADWVKEDFTTRAALIPRLLRAAISIYRANYDKFGEKRGW
jgi:hypothetical protein